MRASGGLGKLPKSDWGRGCHGRGLAVCLRRPPLSWGNRELGKGSEHMSDGSRFLFWNKVENGLGQRGNQE